MRERTLAFRRALYEDAMAVLEREYAKDLALRDVARRIVTSPRALQRAFEQYDTSFREARCAVRMRNAAEQICADPCTPIGDVARGVGYSQQAQFAKAFRRAWGVSPGEYRAASSLHVPV